MVSYNLIDETFNWQRIIFSLLRSELLGRVKEGIGRRPETGHTEPSKLLRSDGRAGSSPLNISGMSQILRQHT